MKKSISPVVMATTEHLAEEEDFKLSLSQSCIAKQYVQTSTVLAQNGNNKENVCIVQEEEAGDTGPLDVKKVYYKQASNARFCAVYNYRYWNGAWGKMWVLECWILSAWLWTQVQVSAAQSQHHLLPIGQHPSISRLNSFSPVGNGPPEWHKGSSHGKGYTH